LAHYVKVIGRLERLLSHLLRHSGVPRRDASVPRENSL
jgi:hypothetical protein